MRRNEAEKFYYGLEKMRFFPRLWAESNSTGSLNWDMLQQPALHATGRSLRAAQ
jgi:hypothetical protein